ncbi:MAG: hypothetical protein JWN66_4412, partial [Sphingomonas bacterium]|nr:hypothetical protein [Sphingomonas bacterium]
MVSLQYDSRVSPMSSKYRDVSVGAFFSNSHAGHANLPKIGFSQRGDIIRRIVGGFPHGGAISNICSWRLAEITALPGARRAPARACPAIGQPLTALSLCPNRKRGVNCSPCNASSPSRPPPPATRSAATSSRRRSGPGRTATIRTSSCSRSASRRSSSVSTRLYSEVSAELKRGAGPLPHPASQTVYYVGGGVGERAEQS